MFSARSSGRTTALFADCSQLSSITGPFPSSCRKNSPPLRGRRDRSPGPNLEFRPGFVLQSRWRLFGYSSAFLTGHPLFGRGVQSEAAIIFSRYEMVCIWLGCGVVCTFTAVHKALNFYRLPRLYERLKCHEAERYASPLPTAHPYPPPPTHTHTNKPVLYHEWTLRRRPEIGVASTAGRR